MRFLLVLILLLTTVIQALKAQDKQVEQFINVIYHDIVPVSYKYYYLLETGESTYAKTSLLNHRAFPYVTRLDSNFTKDMVEKFTSPDSTISWSSYNLQGAVTIPNNITDSMFPNWRSVEMIDYRFYEKHKDSLKKTKPWNEIYAPVNFKWSKKKRMYMVNAYGDSLDRSIPKERDDYFRFSRPVFSNDRKYAVIWYGKGEHDYCLFIYRKEENGSWKILSKIFCIC